LLSGGPGRRRLILHRTIVRVKKKRRGAMVMATVKEMKREVRHHPPDPSTTQRVQPLWRTRYA
jgi:hypothetical protein